jgi:hypothetical protein
MQGLFLFRILWMYQSVYWINLGRRACATSSHMAQPPQQKSNALAQVTNPVYQGAKEGAGNQKPNPRSHTQAYHRPQGKAKKWAMKVHRA